MTNPKDTANNPEFANEFDEFEQPQLEERSQQAASPLDQLKQLWRENPLVKLLAVMGGIAVLIALIIWITSGPETPDKATVTRAPDLQEAPGGQATPAYNEALREAAARETAEALRSGESAIPTPLGRDVNLDDLNADPNANDPLTEFRAEIERLKQQQDQQQEVIQKQAETTPQFNDDLQRKMEQQMTALLESWKPGQMQVIAGAKVDGPGGDVVLGGSGVLNNPENLPLGATVAGGTNALDAARAIVPAGTVNYAQMLVEANSDVPGPIMAQILSGPLKGGRAIGKFEYLEDYLIITFDLINYKGRDYSVDALALDPDTTLGGMATETDARYFKRLVLPAAASFVSALGTSLASGGTTTTVSDGAVISTRAEQGLEDGLFEGMGAAANRVGQFLDEEAAKTKPLVRVATGTPLGLFFVKSVFEGSGNTVNVNGGGFNSLPSLGEDNGTTPADNMFTPPAGYGGSRGPQIQNFPASQGQTQQPPLPDLGPGSSIAIYPR